MSLAILRSRAATNRELNLVGDMYPEGYRVEHPSPSKPVYYFPFVHEFREIGSGSAGVKVTTKRQFIHALAASLYAEGYVATHEVQAAGKEGAASRALAGPPSLVLVVDWGMIHPELLDGSLGGDATTSTAPPQVINQAQMIGLTAGKDFDSTVDFGDETERLLQGLVDDRYFIMVSAYDFEQYFHNHKKVLLWVSKLSVPSVGVDMDQAISALTKYGGSVLGRATRGPQIKEAADIPEGSVKIGEPTEIKP